MNWFEVAKALISKISSIEVKSCEIFVHGAPRGVLSCLHGQHGNLFEVGIHNHALYHIDASAVQRAFAQSAETIGVSVCMRPALQSHVQSIKPGTLMQSQLQ